MDCLDSDSQYDSTKLDLAVYLIAHTSQVIIGQGAELGFSPRTDRSMNSTLR